MWQCVQYGVEGKKGKGGKGKGVDEDAARRLTQRREGAKKGRERERRRRKEWVGVGKQT